MYCKPKGNKKDREDSNIFFELELEESDTLETLANALGGITFVFVSKFGEDEGFPLTRESISSCDNIRSLIYLTPIRTGLSYFNAQPFANQTRPSHKPNLIIHFNF